MAKTGGIKNKRNNLGRLGNETPASTDSVANRETADVINAARVMCEQYQLLYSIVSDISSFQDVDWEQDEHEKTIQRFSRALAKLDVPLTSSPATQPVIARETKTDEEIAREAVGEINSQLNIAGDFHKSPTLSFIYRIILAALHKKSAAKEPTAGKKDDS